MHELVPGDAARERIVLRAVAQKTEQRFGLIRWNTQHPYGALRRTQQSCHQIHESGLAGAVRSHKARDPWRDREIYAIHAKNFAIELRDILECDLPVLAAHRTTSTARTLRPNSARHAQQIRPRTIQAEVAVISDPSDTRNN